ncbi:MAG: phosphopentomutase, partial [Firmicutes bacterium]|nr:phosphopentomutase [Bacillota bacterium]
TSADSVLQIAAHEEIIPLKELYQICEIARELTKDPKYLVGRIIARPYVGTPGNFTRTSNRHDYALDPVSKTDLDELKRMGLDVISIGKISDIFNRRGITKSIKTKDNLDGIQKVIDTMQEKFHGLCFANLNDFDSKYGHRRNVEGYAKALKELDEKIPDLLSHLNDDDLLILTADHGNDPTWTGTDHTRETVPLLIYSNQIKTGKRIPSRESFADLGKTIVDNFNGVTNEEGSSFLNEL